MKVLALVWMAATLACPEPFLLTNDDLVKIHYNYQVVMAKQLVKGHLNLFVSNQFAQKKVTGPFYRKRKMVYVKRYFLKTKNLVALITPFNYKQIIEKHLPNAPELHHRLGRPGFRFDNISSIIRYYNDFHFDDLETLEFFPEKHLELGIENE